MVEAKNKELTDPLKEVNRLWREFGLTTGIFMDSLAEERKNK